MTPAPPFQAGNSPPSRLPCSGTTGRASAVPAAVGQIAIGYPITTRLQTIRGWFSSNSRSTSHDISSRYPDIGNSTD